MCANFEDSSFSHSTDIIGAPNFKVGHVTLTMPLLKVICHSYIMLGLDIAVLIQYRRVMDRRTDEQTHDDSICRASIDQIQRT